MISWLLSKLFSVKTLTDAISMKKEIVAINITSQKDIDEMASMFDHMMPIKFEGNLEHLH